MTWAGLWDDLDFWIDFGSDAPLFCLRHFWNLSLFSDKRLVVAVCKVFERSSFFFRRNSDKQKPCKLRGSWPCFCSLCFVERLLSFRDALFACWQLRFCFSTFRFCCEAIVPLPQLCFALSQSSASFFSFWGLVLAPWCSLLRRVRSLCAFVFVSFSQSLSFVLGGLQWTPGWTSGVRPLLDYWRTDLDRDGPLFCLLRLV